MKSNLQILEERGTLELKWPIEDDFINLMKEAQKEVLHEVVKRKWINSPMSYEYKSLDDIVLELIKEIES